MKTKERMLVLAMAAVLALSGCVSMQSIKEEVVTRVDPISIKDQGKFTLDVDECAQYAAAANQRYQRQAMGRALAGAILGAAIGVAVGGAMGVEKTYLGRSAAVGGITGMTAGAAGTPNWYYAVIGNCLVHRGYWLLY